jgi:tRNA pseudouridine38-40 synthase
MGHARTEGAESYPEKSPFVKWDNGLTALNCPSPIPYLWLVTSRPFLAVVQYDGGQFLGWQRQPAGRTVQGEFEAVLARLMGEPVAATGAGRTDTGVHAVGQGVGFRGAVRWSADVDGLRRALNALLPRDIWVERVHAMRDDFHARRSATARRYRYVIGTDDASHSPFRRPFEWALGQPLEQDLLAAAARTLTGTHDFRGLSAAGPAKPDYLCRVAFASWAPRADGTGVTFTIESDRFLHRMVRFLVGTMVDIALARRPLSDLSQLLAETDNQAASPPAPPQGLYLDAVRYPPDLYAEAHA